MQKFYSDFFSIDRIFVDKTNDLSDETGFIYARLARND